jgi:hypothetical protein
MCEAQPDCCDFISYDTTAWPHVRCTVYNINPTPKQFTAHLACFRELLQVGQPFHILFDLRNARMIDLTYLKQQADFIESEKPSIKAHLVATAILSNNFIVRQGLNMLFAIRKPSRPNASFSEEVLAHGWLQKQWDVAMASRST